MVVKVIFCGFTAPMSDPPLKNAIHILVVASITKCFVEVSCVVGWQAPSIAMPIGLYHRRTPSLTRHVDLYRQQAPSPDLKRRGHPSADFDSSLALYMNVYRRHASPLAKTRSCTAGRLPRHSQLANTSITGRLRPSQKARPFQKGSVPLPGSLPRAVRGSRSPAARRSHCSMQRMLYAHRRTRSRTIDRD